MDFKEKIDEIKKELDNKILSKFSNSSMPLTIQNRNKEVYNLINIFFHSYLQKEFSINSLKEIDIIQSICKYIENHNIEVTNLRLFNSYIKNISNFSLNTNFIIDKKEELKNISSNCEKNINNIIFIK